MAGAGSGLAHILLSEPPGLCVGKVRLADGELEITHYGGWRAYVASRAGARP